MAAEGGPSFYQVGTKVLTNKWEVKLKYLINLPDENDVI